MKPEILPATVSPERTLYIGAVDADFDATRDIAAGPHCFIGCEDASLDWQSLNFIDGFDDKEQIYKTQKDILRLANHLMPRLAGDLNRRHGTSYSVDFWRIITFPWLLELAQSVWTQFNQFEKIVAVHGHQAVRLPLYDKDGAWQFQDLSAFMDALLSDADFNLWFDSKILARLAPANWTLEEAGTIGQTPTEAVAWRPGLLRRIKLGLGYSDVIGTRIGGPLLALFANLLNGAPSRHTIQPQDDFDPGDVFTEPFLDLLAEMMAATLPQSFGDGFPALVARAKGFPVRPGRLRLGTIDLWNDPEKIVAALAKEAGEKLVVCQHGGGYATSKWHVHTTEYEFRNGTFLTWGWSDHDGSDGRFVALPSPALGKVAGRHRGTGGRLILVGDPIRLRMLRLNSGPLGGGWIKYCAESRSLIGALAGRIRDKTSFRPYRGTATDIRETYITDAFPDMPLVDGDLHEAMLDARMIVLRGPGSTLNYSMAAGTPTLVVWNPDLWPLESHAEAVFQDLRDCAIVFDDIDAAARHIDAVWDDIDGWWQSDTVRQARQRYVDRFARTDRWWWWRWAAALLRLRNVG